MFLSPTGLFILYMVLSCLVIMGFRFILPITPPLELYTRSWRAVQGVLAYIELFPALVMAGLVIPFGLTKRQDSFGSFSPEFLKRIKPSIFLAIIGVGAYGLLFCLAYPLAKDYETYLYAQGYLFKSSKEKALISAEKKEWPEVAEFLAVCEQIWPNSPEIEELRTDTIMGMEEWRIAQANTHKDAWVEENEFENIILAYTDTLGRPNPVNAAEALAMADQAFQSERYYDAHWLANLGIRLARQGSPERLQGTQLARRAWNRVGALEPTAKETAIYSLYRKKREGYEALASEDWVKAYYIFKELSVETPGDPDVSRFLEMSEQGLEDVAFFIDEMETILGEIHTEALFSFPLRSSAPPKTGRTVLRIGSLFASKKHSYGASIDLMSFDEDGRLLYRVETPYAKILPVTTASGSKVLLLLRSLDREDRQKVFDPICSGPDQTVSKDARLILDLSYDDFLLLSRLRQGLNPLFVGELMAIAQRIGSYGYIPQLFQAEILYRISEVAVFLPLTILMIVAGWRFRASKPSWVVGIPMLAVLPMVFNGIVFFCRSLIHTFSIWTVIAFGFPLAIVCFTLGMIVLYIFSLIVLSAQHG